MIEKIGAQEQYEAAEPVLQELAVDSLAAKIREARIAKPGGPEYVRGIRRFSDFVGTEEAVRLAESADVSRAKARQAPHAPRLR